LGFGSPGFYCFFLRKLVQAGEEPLRKPRSRLGVEFQDFGFE